MYKYHVVYWAYSKPLKLNYIGVKSFNNFSEFESYQTSSTNWLFKYLLTEKRIIRFCESREEALELEMNLHKDFNVAFNPLFANKARQTSTGFCAIPEYSIERRQKYTEMFTGEGNPFYGKKHTKNTRKKISEANYKRFSTPEARAKHGECQRGITKHSEESKKKIGDFFRGRKRPQHEKDKISMAQRDHTQYLWFHLNKKTGEILEEKVATMQEMKRELGLSQGNLSEIIRGKRKQTRGWHCTCLI